MAFIVDLKPRLGFKSLLLGLNDEHVCGRFCHMCLRLSNRTFYLKLDAEALLVHLLDLLLALEGMSPFISISVMWRISMGRSLFGLDGRIPRWDHFNRSDRLLELRNLFH